ncbi:MAG: hypothetical protein ACOCV8_00125, partial [Spirochaetota bacterium]
MNLIQTKSYKSFKEYIYKENISNILEEKRTKILVGVSGGPDSVFLLLSLLSFYSEKNYKNPSQKIAVAHI